MRMSEKCCNKNNINNNSDNPWTSRRTDGDDKCQLKLVQSVKKYGNRTHQLPYYYRHTSVWCLG